MRTFIAGSLVVAALGCGGGVSLPGSTFDRTSPDSASVRTNGRIWLTTTPTHTTSVVAAQFGGAPPGMRVDTGDVQRFASCEAYAKETFALVSAGTLDVAGARDPWQVSPDSESKYMSTRSVGEWTPGALLTVTATGGSVPAFTGAVVAPPPFRILNEAPDLLAAIERNGDILLRWTPLDAAIVWIGVRAGDREVACSWKGSAGNGTIPGEALATLPAARALMSPVATNQHAIQAGPWWINVIAQMRAQFPDGSVL